MSRKRDTHKYVWKDGNEILSYGITDDIERREKEHQRQKPGSHLRQVGNRTTEDAARNWEKQKLEDYKKRYGKLPPKNKQKG